MGANTKIEWADHTMNFWIGCTKVSPACDHCYAEEWAKRYKRVRWGNHPRERTSPSTWAAPFKWDRDAAAAGERPFVFTNSLADIFDNQVPPEWRTEAFDVMRATPNLIWLLLTKRPQNIVALSKAAYGLPANAALGATVVTQSEADRDIPKLLEAKAELAPAFAFLSIEPMLTAIDLGDARYRFKGGYNRSAFEGCGWGSGHRAQAGVDWVIAGGESGPHARASHPDWFRTLRGQCEAAGAPFLFKQWGEWGPGDGPPLNVGGEIVFGMARVGKKTAGRELDHCTHDDRPALPSLKQEAA